MVNVTKIRGATSQEVAQALLKGFRENGFDAQVHVKNPTSVGYTLRVDTKARGYRVSPYTGRRGNVMGWEDWFDANNLVNDALDKMNVSANISSLGGKFKIREGTKRFGRGDWYHLENENVGSQFEPVARRDAWLPE